MTHKSAASCFRSISLTWGRLNVRPTLGHSKARTRVDQYQVDVCGSLLITEGYFQSTIPRSTPSNVYKFPTRQCAMYRQPYSSHPHPMYRRDRLFEPHSSQSPKRTPLIITINISQSTQYTILSISLNSTTPNFPQPFPALLPPDW
jgi:hypothetical protein